VDLVRSIGADHVIDYTREDFRQGDRRYDLILDLAGSGPLAARTRPLSPDGILVAVGGPVEGLWLAPLVGALKMPLVAKVRGTKMVGMLTKQSPDDLAAVHELLEAGKVTPVIDRTYPLSEAPQALAYLGEGHARGKVVITI
jgi:NADPH:quinone reductase-like Zn-dependent oxidoreductase